MRTNGQQGRKCSWVTQLVKVLTEYKQHNEKTTRFLPDMFPDACWKGAHCWAGSEVVLTLGNRDATVPSVLLHTHGDSQDKQSSAEVTSQNQPQVKYHWSVKSVGLWNHFSGKQPDTPSAVTMTLPSAHLYWYFPYDLYRKPLSYIGIPVSVV